MAVELPLVLASIALVLSTAALVRAFKPPQTRRVLELAAEIAELQTGVDALSRRLTKRGQVENMDKAREAHEDRRTRQDRIEAEALALIQQKQQQQQSLPLDEHAQRAQLRAKVLQ